MSAEFIFVMTCSAILAEPFGSAEQSSANKRFGSAETGFGRSLQKCVNSHDEYVKFLESEESMLAFVETEIEIRNFANLYNMTIASLSGLVTYVLKVMSCYIVVIQ